MSGQRKKFTENEMRLLAANPYTYRITESTIRFTKIFKEEFLKRYKEGYSVRQIVTDLGYDINILGSRRVEGIRDHITKEALSPAGLHEGSLFAKIKPCSRDYTELPPNKAIEYMQQELLYLRQEVEFIKKIIAVENGKRHKK